MPDPAKVYPPLPAQDAVKGDFNPYTGGSNQCAQAATTAAAHAGFPGALTVKPAGDAIIVGHAVDQAGSMRLAMAAARTLRFLTPGRDAAALALRSAGEIQVAGEAREPQAAGRVGAGAPGGGAEASTDAQDEGAEPEIFPTTRTRTSWTPHEPSPAAQPNTMLHASDPSMMLHASEPSFTSPHTTADRPAFYRGRGPHLFFPGDFDDCDSDDDNDFFIALMEAEARITAAAARVAATSADVDTVAAEATVDRVATERPIAAKLATDESAAEHVAATMAAGDDIDGTFAAEQTRLAAATRATVDELAAERVAAAQVLAVDATWAAAMAVAIQSAAGRATAVHIGAGSKAAVDQLAVGLVATTCVNE
jgi:hypothetical protein